MTESTHTYAPISRDFTRFAPKNGSPSVPVTPEREVHFRLDKEWKLHFLHSSTYCRPKKQLLVVDLHCFEIYYHPGNEHREYELICLHFLGATGGKKLCFDGVVHLGNVQYYMRDIPIHDSCTNVDGNQHADSLHITAYIQSEFGADDRTHDIWYRLKQPSTRYQRFHDAFIWIGQLSKHVIDYMNNARRSLICFRSDFHSYLAERFGGNTNFDRWHAAFEKKTDFRVAVVAYIDYLLRQAYHEPNSDRLVNQPLWVECMARAVTPQLQSISHEPTLATPAVYACFKGTKFGDKLREVRPKEKVEVAQEQRKRNLGFAETQTPLTYAELSEYCQPYGASPVMVGDVVAIVPDETDKKAWPNTKRDWLAYVQRTDIRPDGLQELYVLWLYWPCDTNITGAFYPFENELFLSDNCNCENGELLSSDIKGKYFVDWCPSFPDVKRFFVRQKYTEESSFVTLTDEHKICHCDREKSQPKYRPGDTVYWEPRNNSTVLEPVVIQEIDAETGLVSVRKLLRLSRDCAELAAEAQRSQMADNELVLTNVAREVEISELRHHCFIRFVSKTGVINDQIPFPYNCGGAGDFWFISMRLIKKDEKESLKFLQSLPKNIRQRVKSGCGPKLKGLPIFSGGGLLDRGLEEAGAVEFHTVVDSNVSAIRTQQANIKDPKRVCLYCGSVNTFFDSALRGDVEYVASVGNVEFIAAACPCVAFSSLQRNTESITSLYNASLITSFCSYVDLYRPLYAVLENVLEVSTKRTDYLLCQVVASLVSMGYQVSQFIMDSWSYGSSQRRSRLILTIAAPSLHPIMQPMHTHNLPKEEFASRSLGKLPSGLPYGTRRYYSTPFRHVPAVAVSSGLPHIGNSLVQTCIPYPDHRVAQLPTWIDRALLEYTPQDPPGSGYQEAMDHGPIPPHLGKDRKISVKSFTRMKENGLVPTIMTEARVSNAQAPAIVHWEEPRPISLLEARRAQGMSDDEPIIGPLREQYKIVSNGVDRKVSFAIGLGLVYAQEKNRRQHALNDVAENSRMTTENVSDTEFAPVSSEEEAVCTPNDTFDSGILISTKSSISKKRKLSLILPDRSRSPSMTSQQSDQTPEVRPYSNKRLKMQARTSEIVDLDGDSEYMLTSLAPEEDRTQGSTSSTRTRYTRHSGLTVGFVPKHWNKRVEMEYRNSKL